MADIDELIGKQGLDGIDQAIVKMETLYDVILKDIKAATQLTNEIANSKNIKDLASSIEDLQRKVNGVSASQKIYTQAMADAAITRQKEIAAMKDVSRETLAVTTAYEKAAVAQKRLEETAKAAWFEFGKGSQQFKAAAEASNKALNEIKALDATLGNAKRNVGNYNNQLFSMTQVLRELPAFTYSAQMGIMAVSNNLPMLADEFRRVKAEVGGTLPALAKFGKSLLTFPNIFAIAIGLFTIYYKEISSFIGINDKAKESVDALAEAVKGTEVVSAKEGLLKLSESIKLVKEGTISSEAALKLYNETMGQTAGKLDNWQLAEEQILKNGNAWIQLTIDKAKAQVHLNRAVELGLNQEEGPNMLDQLKAGLLTSPLVISNWGKNSAELTQKFTDILVSTLQKRNFKLKEQVEEETKLFADLNKSIAEREKQLGFKGEEKSGTKSTVGKTAKDLVDKAKEAKKAFDDAMAKAYRIFDGDPMGSNEEKEVVKRQIARLEAFQKKFNEISDDIKRSWLGLQPDLSDEAANQLNIDINNRERGGGTKEKEKKENELLEKKLDLLKDYVQQAQQILGGLADFTDSLFAREMANLDAKEQRLNELHDQELKQIEASGLSQGKKEKAKQRLEAETAAKQKQIDKEKRKATVEQAKLDKVYMALQIIGATGIAIMQSWKNPALAIAAGVTGALQLAALAAAPLPAYKDGRKGGPATMALVSEVGQEGMIDKQGNFSLLPAKPAITFIPEGASVIPFNEMVKTGALTRLAKEGGTVTTDRMQDALLAETVEQLIGLRSDLRAKNFNLNENTLRGYDSYIQSKIK